MTREPGPGADIVVVCTANLCRSPAAGAVLASGMADLGLTVVSAGTNARTGAPADERTRAGVPELADDFRAQQLTPGTLSGALLVLTMTRQHRSAVVASAPVVVRRSFTLTEFADLARLVPADPEPLAPRERLRRLVAAAPRLRGARAVTSPRPDDIEDPYRMPDDAYTQVLGEVRRAAEDVVQLIRGTSIDPPAC